MGEKKLTLKTGINTQATQLAAEGTWSTSNLIRWKDGYLEKYMGWQAFTPEPVEAGIARALHGWQDLDLNKYLAIGTNAVLELYNAGAMTDITPLRDTNNSTPDFTTTSGSATVTVKDVAHGAAAGDYVNLFVPVSVGGLILYGLYEIVTIVDVDNYTITAASNATASVSNGGAVPLFATTNTSATVHVTFVNNGYAIGDIFTVPVSTVVGGITFSGSYLVNSLVSADEFTIIAASTASSTTTGSENGGNARFEYYLSTGPESTTALTGYGTGGYGLGSYGMSSGGVAYEPLRYWYLDNFGEYLMAVPTNGALYVWQPPIASGTRATFVATAPIYNAGMFVAMPQAQVVLLGAETGGTQDPLLVRWSDNGDYTDYTATSTNQAGSYRLSRGSTIIGGFQAPQAALIWTDTDLWSMTYQGAPFVYGFETIGSACGLIAPKASAALGRQVYWMSVKGFFTYVSSVAPLQCTVWDEVFTNLDTANQDKCIAAANTPLNEIAWFYPSTSGTGEIDSYVKFNVLTGEWDYGSLVRTAWLDQNIFGLPLGVDSTGLVQQHETTYNDNGAAMTGVSAETGFIDIAEGADYLFVDRIIPDFILRGTDPSISMTVYTSNYPGGDVTTHGPYAITSDTQFINFRGRARQIAFSINCDAIDTWFRLGAVRVRVAQSGRR